MANVAINVEVRSNGEVVLGKLGNALDVVDNKAKGLNARMGGFADAAGRTATTLARSADSFGLNASALRALDDVMDVAELGFNNISKAAAGFNAATLGVIGAGAALGAVIGGWLNQFKAVREGADHLTKSILTMFGAFDQGKIANATAGLKSWQIAMKAAQDDAIKRQVGGLRGMGVSEKDLLKQYGGRISDELAKELRLTKEILATDQKRAEEMRRLIDLMSNKRPVNFGAAMQPGMGALMGGGIATSLNNLSENRVTVGGQATSLMGSLMGLGPATSLNIGSGMAYQMEQIAKAKKLQDEATVAAARWQAGLQGVALLAGAVTGKFSDMLVVIGNIGQSFQGWKTMTPTQKFNTIASGVGQIGGAIGGKAGGFLSGAAGGAMMGAALGSVVPGIGTVIGGVVGGVAGGIAGIFGAGKKKKEEERQALEQFNALKDALVDQYGTLEEAARMAEKYGVNLRAALDTKSSKQLEAALAAVEKRMAGLRTATTGISTIIDNLTYKDAAGNLLNTFNDPSVAESAAQLFGAQFWQVFSKQGIGAIEELRPAWDKLHQQLISMGLDPVALGLGRVGRMFDITNDPKTRALLGVSSGATQFVKGAMEGGYMDTGLLKDSANIAENTLSELQNQGLSAEEAAQAMGDQLAAIAQAYKATGAELPEWLADALAGAGIEVLPTQLEVMREMRDYLKIMAGREGAANGMVGDFGRGTWVPLHGREMVVPLDRPSRFGGRSMSVTVNRSLNETEYDLERRVLRHVRRALREDPRMQHDARVAVNGGR